METSLSRQQTMEYLRIASELETSVYAQESFLKKLREKRAAAESVCRDWASKKIPEVYDFSRTHFNRFIHGFFGIEVGIFNWCRDAENAFIGILGIFWIDIVGLHSFLAMGVAEVIFGTAQFEVESKEFVISYLIALGISHFIPAIINMLITGIVNRKDAKLTLQMEEEQKAALEKRKQGIAEWQGKEREIEKWIKSAEASLAETKEDLRKLYALDVIYPKYRNFIAACTIYEYFKSGRCYTLTGHEGAYNLYESELKQNIIISMLQDISTQMNKIIQNQYVLWQAIEDTNDRISGLSSKVDSSVAKLSAEVESAKYSAQLAEQNTNYLVYLESVKNS